jgi:hypothetical protein
MPLAITSPRATFPSFTRREMPLPRFTSLPPSAKRSGRCWYCHAAIRRSSRSSWKSKRRAKWTKRHRCAGRRGECRETRDIGSGEGARPDHDGTDGVVQFDRSDASIQGCEHCMSRGVQPYRAGSACGLRPVAICPFILTVRLSDAADKTPSARERRPVDFVGGSVKAQLRGGCAGARARAACKASSPTSLESKSLSAKRTSASRTYTRVECTSGTPRAFGRATTPNARMR